MPGLAEQRIIIEELAQTTLVRRVRLREACRGIHPSVATVDKAKRCAGTALIAADIVSGVTAFIKALRTHHRPGEQRRRLLGVFLEAPRILNALRRLRPRNQATVMVEMAG